MGKKLRHPDGHFAGRPRTAPWGLTCAQAARVFTGVRAAGRGSYLLLGALLYHFKEQAIAHPRECPLSAEPDALATLVAAMRARAADIKLGARGWFTGLDG